MSAISHRLHQLSHYWIVESLEVSCETGEFSLTCLLVVILDVGTFLRTVDRRQFCSCVSVETWSTNFDLNRPDRYLRTLMLSRSKTSQRSLRSRVNCVQTVNRDDEIAEISPRSGVQNERCALFWQNETSRELGIPNWSIRVVRGSGTSV